AVSAPSGWSFFVGSWAATDRPGVQSSMARMARQANWRKCAYMRDSPNAAEPPPNVERNSFRFDTHRGDANGIKSVLRDAHWCASKVMTNDHNRILVIL